MRHKLLAVTLSLVVALSMGTDAWARAGKSSSLGSRGSRTYDRPIERSVTPPPATSAPQRPAIEQAPLSQPGAQPMYNPNAVRQPGMAAPMAPAAQPGFFQRNPVMGGILGGLVGAGIGSMLFGHSPAMAAASGAAPGASMFGLLLQLALVGGLAWLAYRWFRRRSEPQPQAQGQVHGQPEVIDAEYRRAYGLPAERTLPPADGVGTPVRRVEKEFELSADDQNAFSQIIAGVQKSWSDGNPVALRQFVTPEVAGWMAEDQARDQSRGVRNVVEDVQLLKGDISESWRDAELEYATAIITFAAKDYVVRLSDNQVIEGDAKVPVETTEAWTFVRSAGGKWLLSAIEQI